MVAWFALPALLIVLALAGYPLFDTLRLSLTDARLGNLDHPAWVGLENYRVLLADSDWWRAVANTLVFTVASVSIETMLGVAFALLLNSGMRAQPGLRAAVLVPWAIPAVVSARMWSWIFNDSFGVLNEMLLKLGLISAPIAWTADDRLALLTITLVDVWKTTPFMTLLILAGLQAIPKSTLEAALVDGAGPWRRFRSVILPQLKPAILVALLFRTLDALRIFDLPFVLTSNSRATAVVSIYARQQMVDFQDVGLGAAASIAVFCLIAVIAIAYLSTMRRDLEGEPT